MRSRTGTVRTWRPVALALVLLLAGCGTYQPRGSDATAHLTPSNPITRDLLSLPEPKGKVVAAVYSLRDQTGQYKPAPDSSFSTAVTQGASSLLVRALKDSGWFLTVERENLQNLLTERKIVRALETAPASGSAPVQIPALTAASILVEGGIVAYESNVRSGGVGAQFLGVGLSSLYRVDQVTVNLRSVDIRSGLVLDSVSTTKTIYSYEVRPSVFKFVNPKDLIEFEAGVTRNEPAQLAVNEAIEAAVVHLIVQGVKSKAWELKDGRDWNHDLVQRYLRDRDTYYRSTHGGAVGAMHPAIGSTASALADANGNPSP